MATKRWGMVMIGMFVMFELGILSPMGQSMSVNLVMVVLVMLGL